MHDSLKNPVKTYNPIKGISCCNGSTISKKKLYKWGCNVISCDHCGKIAAYSSKGTVIILDNQNSVKECKKNDVLAFIPSTEYLNEIKRINDCPK